MLLHRFSGAVISRTIDRSHSRVPEHAHDWPLLSFFVLGAYSNRTDVGERNICGPSAVLYGVGAHHANTASTDGFEQIEIEFDPLWLNCSGLPRAPVTHWTGGGIGAATRAVIHACAKPLDEERIASVLRRFLTLAVGQSAERRPAWVDQVTRRLRQGAALRVTELAREVDRHPAWLGTAYKQAVGESILETATRLRVEHAVRLLRETDLSYCEIAHDASFCDQSHMNRSFRRLLDRLPSTVRNERSDFRDFAPHG
ncbi:MAG: helix-turn-helix domain-containing protein [Steroidobacteraceae bacterium]